MILAPGVTLPASAVTQTFGILAKRGAGKSNTAAVMAEEMFAARLPFVVVDPVGAWWGLRSSGDGRSAGLSVPIFGGHRGDIPLEAGGAEFVADLIVDQRLSCVLDVSAFESEGLKRRFLSAFAERLFRRKGQPGNDDPLHLFLEEADDYAPQRAAGPDVNRTLGAFQRIVKQGRARGLGSTMITQRSAVLNKDLLTQIETLIVMRTTSPQDRKAISAWVEYHGQSAELLASLHELKDGEAWVWSPWLNVTKRVQVRRRSTFDSGATPTVSSKAKRIATLADIDLGALRDRMSEMIERAKADDPVELRRRIRELEASLKRAEQGRAQPEVREVEVERVPAGVEDKLLDLTKTVDRLGNDLSLVHDELSVVYGKVKGVKDSSAAGVRVARPAERETGVRGGRPRGPSAPVSKPASADTDVQLKKGARAILETLARHHPMRFTRSQVGVLTGFKITGGTFGTYWSVLKRAGYVVEQGDESWVTEVGLDVAGVVPAAPATTEEMLELWRPRLKAGARKMLDALVLAYPAGFAREQFAFAVEMEPTGGTFGTYLSVLRRNGLAEIEGDLVRASPSLFITGN